MNSAAKGLASSSLNDSRLFCSGSCWDFLKSFIKFISGIKGRETHIQSAAICERLHATAKPVGEDEEEEEEELYMLTCSEEHV